mmetsp:Transcript_21537/g.43239  ORF Transcript_21537/g.43239 Transcript_21537/m.43239 type:complete len:209 (-) Transcript_21537:554-1180(-)
MRNTVIESWPRLETRTKRPVGSTQMRPHVLYIEGKPSGTVEMLWIWVRLGKLSPASIFSMAEGSNLNTATVQLISLMRYATFSSRWNSMYLGPWGPSLVSSEGILPRCSRWPVFASNRYWCTQSCPRSGTKATVPSWGSSTMECAWADVCLSAAVSGSFNECLRCSPALGAGWRLVTASAASNFVSISFTLSTGVPSLRGKVPSVESQ